MEQVETRADRAKAIQAARDSVDLKNHTERLAWLEQPSPRWACGKLVDAHTRHALIAQSREFIARIGGGK